MGKSARGARRTARARRAGYTLTEMLVVLVIIGLISAIVVPQTLGQMDRAKVRAARLKMESVAAALEMYSADLARYPTREEGLPALIDPPEGVAEWAGPYLSDAALTRDPWGRPVVYTPPAAMGDRFKLTSYGADGAPGGDGFKRDIVLQASQ
ncbi:type II secretion system major pseudopilin GspG [Brevundimonas sp.]|uniref:type II secretion system major pseudopilin GspG n=1 Tax=Brevundimonas sp. TaxID=1871086 RepID=UPI002D2F62C3|nr:type II secretion system major pseudopilin GspG [Brevundimonas sp.]HYC98449.1 type II secretion system major pseudopilin GspG [Brevundimonas sp.]